MDRCVDPERVVNVLEEKDKTVVVVCGRCNGCLVRKVVFLDSLDGVCRMLFLLQTDSTTCARTVSGG